MDYACGQDPTISERQVDTVLDLANKGGRLYNYIFGELLGPLGVTPEMVYATNLIKCRFPNNQTQKRFVRDIKRRWKNSCSHFLINAGSGLWKSWRRFNRESLFPLANLFISCCSRASKEYSRTNERGVFPRLPSTESFFFYLCAVYSYKFENS